MKMDENQLLLSIEELYKDNNYQECLKIIEENEDVIIKKYYEIIPFKINCLIKLNKLIDALLIIKEELNVPYIPSLFETFLKETRLNHRTVVIILTDCRDWNGKRENGVLESAEILKKIVQRSERVVILNPESKKRWNTPTSCVEDYRQAGAEIFEIKNLDNLSKFVTEL